MGKKLRNRQISNDRDLQHTTKQKPLSPAGVLPNNKLKKMIVKKFEKNDSHTSKHTKFDQRLQNGSIHSIIQQTALECPICLEMLVQPTMMLCGHLYCFRCLDSNAAHSRRCCLCRSDQMDAPHLPSRFAQNLINKIVLPKSDQIIRYLCRTTDSNQWTKRRYVSNLRPGLVVDFQDSLNFWRRAAVVEVFLNHDQKAMVNLKVLGKGSEVFQTVEISSKRLAPSKFFTRGRYLQQFLPALPEYDFHQKQLHKLEYKQSFQQQQFFINPPCDINWQDEHDQSLENEAEQPSENFLDEALVLFNMEMGQNQLII